MNRKHYSIAELINEPSFRRMVKGTASSEEVEKWNAWIEENHQNRKNAKAAFSAITGFGFTDPHFPDVQKEWEKLAAKTSGLKKIKSLAVKKNENRLKWIYRIAASFFVIGFISLLMLNLPEENEAVTHLNQITEEKTVTTSSGEQKTLTFSNGSKVVLNSNSSFTYQIGLLYNQPINVTLEGEAYFDVPEQSGKTDPVFAVITPGGIIRDIGTKFLVSVKNGWTRIVLQEGFVEVESAVSPDIYHVEKGEMVEFNQANILTRKQVNPTFFTSWATHHMQFNRTEITEFAEYLKQRFAVKVQVTDSALADVTLDGAVYFRSIDELISSVSKVTGIPVYRSEADNTIYIGNPD